MTASVHRISDILDPVQSAFSDSERLAILQETKSLLAEGRPTGRNLNSAHVRNFPVEMERVATPEPEEDALRKYQRLANEQAAREEREREQDRRDQEERRQKLERQARRQRRDVTVAWQAHLETRLQTERDFMVAVVGEIVAGFEAKITKLEIELQELKK